MSNENRPNIGEDYIRFHKVMTRGLAVSLQNIDEFSNIGAYINSCYLGLVTFIF